jgi:hypothetical protein
VQVWVGFYERIASINYDLQELLSRAGRPEESL